MAANGSLAEDDQTAGENVRAFHRDRDGDALIASGEVIARPHGNTASAVNVHGVVDHLTHALGEVVLDDGGNDRGALTHIHGHRGQGSSRVHEIGVAADARQRFLDAFELSYRRIELFANRGVGAGDAPGELAGSGAQRRKRYGAPRRQRLHQHHPSLSGHGGSADDPVHRNEYVLAGIRAVVKSLVHRPVSVADGDSRSVGRDQGQGDARRLVLAQQALGIVQLEGKPQQRGHRAQSDIALAPVEPDPQHVLFAFKGSAADHADILHRACVAARLGSGEGETGDLVSLGQPRKVMIFLRLGPVVQQQLRRTQRVGYHHRYRRGDASAGNLHHHR